MSYQGEIFLFKNDVVLYTITDILGLTENEKIKVVNTPLLEKFGIEGEKAYIKYSTFILHTRIVGKTKDYVILDFPTLNPEKPLGDRKSVRVNPASERPVKVMIEDKEKNVNDISEVGFSVKCSVEEVENVINGELLNVRIRLPNYEDLISGQAQIVNIRETKNGNILCGYELFLKDEDTVKVRFYLYERIKEILKSIK